MFRLRFAPALTGGLALLVLASGTGAAVQPAAAALPGMAHLSGTSVEPDEQVIVRYRRGAALRTRGSAHVGGLLGSDASTRVLAIPAGGDAEAYARQLERDPRVEYAVPNRRYAVADADPYASRQWGLHAPDSDVDIDHPEASGRAQGSPSVVVAVLDTGTDIGHPDLAGSVYTNAAQAKGRRGIDDDRNGYVDDVHGWDFLGNDPHVFDDPAEDEHGTHVAGILAARAGNGTGIAGVASGVTILPLKFIGRDGGYTTDAIEAIAYARRMGAQVINLSWGENAYDPALRDALARSGMLAVAAAGNKGQDSDVRPFYPAAYSLPNVVSVTAVDAAGRLPKWANRGARSVELAAPGAGIVSTVPGGYGYLDGTSMAAPHVAGVAALLAGTEPDLSSSRLADRLLATATALPALAGVTRTGDLVNAAAAVGAVPVASVRGRAGVGEATVRWRNPRDADFAEVVVRVAEGTTVPGPEDGRQAYAGRASTARISGLAPGSTYTVAVYAFDARGARPVVALRLLGTSLRTRPALASGDAVVLRSVLTRGPVALARRRVELLAQDPASGHWARVCRVSTAADGGASCTVSRLEQRPLQWRFAGSGSHLGAVAAIKARTG
ncbi:MAG: S8 family serine peptidase [Actinomycetota bacterium]|nr:S8 family serine peptidase [Actinomycetota bacterium]